MINIGTVAEVVQSGFPLPAAGLLHFHPVRRVGPEHNHAHDWPQASESVPARKVPGTATCAHDQQIAAPYRNDRRSECRH